MKNLIRFVIASLFSISVEFFISSKFGNSSWFMENLFMIMFFIVPFISVLFIYFLDRKIARKTSKIPYIISIAVYFAFWIETFSIALTHAPIGKGW